MTSGTQILQPQSFTLFDTQKVKILTIHEAACLGITYLSESSVKTIDQIHLLGGTLCSILKNLGQTPKTLHVSWIEGQSRIVWLPGPSTVGKPVTDLSGFTASPSLAQEFPFKDMTQQYRYSELEKAFSGVTLSKTSLVGPDGQLYGHCAETLSWIALQQ